MALIKVSAILLSGTIGIGGLSITAAHLCTLETIWDVIKDDILPGEGVFSAEWTAIQKKLNNSSSTPKTQSLKEIKNTNESSPATGDKVKNWCTEIYTSVYQSLIKSKNSDLLEDAKEFCIYKIKEKLTESKLFKTEGDTDKSDIERRLQELKSHEDTKGKLDETLSELKKKIVKVSESSDNKDWEILRDWCKNVYERGYRGQNTDTWKIANLYCQKN